MSCSVHENVVVAGATVPLHQHAVEEVIVCLAGTAECSFNGGTPEKFHIGAPLAAHGLDASALVKLTMFVVAGRTSGVRAARAKLLGAHRPASTAVFVSQLVDPAWHVEVEAVAAKSRT